MTAVMDHMYTDWGGSRWLDTHRNSLAKQLNLDAVLPKLVHAGVLSFQEDGRILKAAERNRQVDIFIECLSKKGQVAFAEFFQIVGAVQPDLLTKLLVESAGVEENSPTQALQLGFELALRERDAALRESARAAEERDSAMKQFLDMKGERNQALASLEHLAGRSPKLNNREKELNDMNGPGPYQGGQFGPPRSMPSPIFPLNGSWDKTGYDAEVLHRKRRIVFIHPVFY